jgi:hypothetical protein
MAYIRSANQSNFNPSTNGELVYVHGADTRKHYVPFAFQVTSPYDYHKVLLPHALISHVNPMSFSETFTKKVERIQTRGGFVEQHWGDDLTEISVDQSTGAFINLNTGLSSVLRQRTIAWDRYRDLYDLYRNNGSVYDPFGNIVLQGWILIMFDRGTYVGTFRTFSVEETDDSPFAFKVSWTFKVEHVIQMIPVDISRTPISGRGATIQNMGGKIINITDQGASYLGQQAQQKADENNKVLEASAREFSDKQTKELSQSLEGYLKSTPTVREKSLTHKIPIMEGDNLDRAFSKTQQEMLLNDALSSTAKDEASKISPEQAKELSKVIGSRTSSKERAPKIPIKSEDNPGLGSDFLKALLES